MSQNKYKRKYFKTWESFKKFANSFSENWIFRGQSNSSWELETSLERSGFATKYENIEISFLNDFKRGAENFLSSKNIPTNLIEWLALMQHHGAPTRLLDFSKSIFIASYFAFKSLESNADNVAIWAIDINTITNKVKDHLWSHFETDFQKKFGVFTYEIFEKIFYSNFYECILPLEPFKMNKRYYLQQSIFLSSGNSTLSFMEQLEFLDNLQQDSIIKMILPNKLNKEVLFDLNKMNINEASIFPDLDGYAKSLKMRYSIMKTISERIDDIVKEKEKIYRYKI